METYFYPDELEGGRNLLLGTATIDNPSQIRGYSQSGGGYYNSRSYYEDSLFKNSKVLRLTSDKTSNDSYFFYDVSLLDEQYRKKMMVSGYDYYVSFYLKTSFSTPSAFTFAQGVDRFSQSLFSLNANEWKKVEFSLPNALFSNTTKVFVGFRIRPTSQVSINIGDTIDIANFKMERSGGFSDWLKAPSDLGYEVPNEIMNFSLGYNNGYITIPLSKRLKKDGSLRKLENKTENFIVSNLKLEDMVNKLATNFAKDKNSNNYKLLNLAYLQLKKLEQDLNKQLDWMDINKAKGYALDLIGKRVGMFRGLMDDDKYRVRIKSKISENLSDGTVNTVIEALALALNINVDKVHIRPLFPEGKPATIIIENIPASSLNKAGITQEELVEMVQKIIATGVRVESINLEGTFRFSPIRNQVVVNAATGLSDIAMTTGGKLGAILSTN